MLLAHRRLEAAEERRDGRHARRRLPRQPEARARLQQPHQPPLTAAEAAGGARVHPRHIAAVGRLVRQTRPQRGPDRPPCPRHPLRVPALIVVRPTTPQAAASERVVAAAAAAAIGAAPWWRVVLVDDLAATYDLQRGQAAQRPVLGHRSATQQRSSYMMLETKTKMNRITRNCFLSYSTIYDHFITLWYCIEQQLHSYWLWLDLNIVPCFIIDDF